MSLVLPNFSQHQSASLQRSTGLPAATLLLVTYQHEAFVAEAVRSALAQTFSPLQIVISDDCSTDATWDIIIRECKNYAGPHHVILNRNPERLFLKHWRHVQPMLKGRHIILGCGDDIFMPNRVAANMEVFRTTSAAVVTSNCVLINDEGAEIGPFQDATVAHDVSLEAFFDKGATIMCHGASMAWDSHVIDRFGPLPIMRNIDWIIPFRGLLLGGNHYIHEPLMYYRFHESNSALCLKLERQDDALEREKIVEAQRCQRLVNDRHMSADIGKLRAIDPNHPRLSYLIERMNERLIRDLDDWATLRTDWVLRGIGA